jgi:hypothetical protein
MTECKERNALFNSRLRSLIPTVTGRDVAMQRSASANVTRGHPPELEFRGAGRHGRVLSGELA